MKKKTIIIVSALIMSVGIMLLVGLKPKGFRLLNDVGWLTQRPGISFGRIGIAYTEDLLTWPQTSSGSITIELNVKPMGRMHGVPVMLSLHDEASRDPLVIGQWCEDIVIRKRDPGSRRGYREMGADSLLVSGSSSLITIVSDNGWTTVYANGLRSGDSAQISLAPNVDNGHRLILGNVATSKQPWNGEMYSVNISARALSSAEIFHRFHVWDSLGRTIIPPIDNAIVSYGFGEKKGRSTSNLAGTRNNLHIPKILQMLHLQILIPPWEDFSWELNSLEDFLVNLFGFIPFGFLLLTLFVSVMNMRINRALMFAVLGGLIFSLFIELAQVWIPTRCSQLSDLILNTAGTWFGAMIAVRVKKTL